MSKNFEIRFKIAHNNGKIINLTQGSSLQYLYRNKLSFRDNPVHNFNFILLICSNVFL